MLALGYDVLKPAELKFGDVVVYFKDSGGAFRDLMVTKIEDDGVYLRRPYIDASTKKAEYEELYWRKDSNFLFQLLRRP